MWSNPTKYTAAIQSSRPVVSCVVCDFEDSAVDRSPAHAPAHVRGHSPASLPSLPPTRVHDCRATRHIAAAVFCSILLRMGFLLHRGALREAFHIATMGATAISTGLSARCIRIMRKLCMHMRCATDLDRRGEVLFQYRLHAGDRHQMEIEVQLLLEHAIHGSMLNARRGCRLLLWLHAASRLNVAELWCQCEEVCECDTGRGSVKVRGHCRRC